MKTNDKTKFPPSKGGASGGQRNGKHRGQGKRKEPFFQPVVSKSESNAHNKDRGSGTGGRSYGKHGAGVHKTVAFKPKHEHRQGKESKKPINDNKRQNGRPQHGKQKQQQHHQYGNKRSPAPTKPSVPSEIRFDSKPEKVNYCLAPERLEAQTRAIKQFEQKEREEEIVRKKQDRQQKHKMMTQKTRKGQPVMQGRLELLYEKVKKVVGVQ
ncbi:uncharacterized protein LOC126556325 [Anopheles maculipalpis]|uniref:uncharacterized protein LOC126556325 n=1 Tax=Anopheles maculipalpis TaxID=1496333 RepID=UPI0021590D2A|nr:uncharacterized protein LOC126556325 [Anopheles maculipalpis]